MTHWIFKIMYFYDVEFVLCSLLGPSLFEDHSSVYSHAVFSFESVVKSMLPFKVIFFFLNSKIFPNFCGLFKVLSRIPGHPVLLSVYHVANILLRWNASGTGSVCVNTVVLHLKCFPWLQTCKTSLISFLAFAWWKNLFY